MNDQEREFVNLIDNMEREVLELKTAHQRPLGTLNFFQKNVSFNINMSAGGFGASFNLIVNVATPTAKPPIVQMGWEIPSGFYDVSVMNMSVNGDYTVWTYELFLANIDGTAKTVNFNAGAISAQPIESLTWSINYS